MKVWTMNGRVHDFPDARTFITTSTLQIVSKYNGYVGGAVVAEFPLVSVERWEP